jgi:hypothetical protein
MKCLLWVTLRITCAFTIAIFLLPQSVLAQAKSVPEPTAIPAEQFAKLHQLIKPQPGELRFHEIPWFLSVWEARHKAAQEGKPILVWSGSGGAPLGVC